MLNIISTQFLTRIVKDSLLFVAEKNVWEDLQLPEFGKLPSRSIYRRIFNKHARTV